MPPDEKVLAFLRTLPIVAGLKAGETLELLEFQEQFVRGVYGDLDDLGRRRVRLAALSVARGNGKSAILAGLEPRAPARADAGALWRVLRRCARSGAGGRALPNDAGLYRGNAVDGGAGERQRLAQRNHRRGKRDRSGGRSRPTRARRTASRRRSGLPTRWRNGEAASCGTTSRPAWASAPRR